MDQVLKGNDPVWLDAGSCSLDDFRALVEVDTSTDSVPLASDISSNIPIYDAAAVRAALGERDRLRAFMAEWNRVLATGPGVVVFKNTYEDTDLVDAVTGVLDTIIAEEESQSAGSGDHFAPAGANSRVWNAHEKLCMADPTVSVR